MRTARVGVLPTWQVLSIGVPWRPSLTVAIVTHLVTRLTPRVLSIQAALVSVDGETAEAHAEASEDSSDGRQGHTVSMAHAWPAGIRLRLGLYLRVAAVMIFCVEEDHER